MASQVSALRSVVDVEIESAEQSPRIKEWEIACGKRNSAAHTLTHTLQRDELTALLGKKGTRPIFDQATRYQNFIDENQKNKNLSIETELRSHLEPLLYKIFPEGPQRKNKQEFRFGGKGSLSVICSGDKAGQFYDFERQEGGSMLKLVQRELGLGRLEAQEWAKEFLGIAHDIKVPKAFLRGPAALSKDSDWVSIKPDPKVPAPSLERISNGTLQHYFAEAARHSYKDENGELLYYRLRLTDKTDSSKKITPPLSYGYWKSNPENLCWEMKGYSSEKAILYNLSALKENPLATVLIVEGEKTADKALNKFQGESFVCITWPGGAGAARRADWSPLIGRNIIIWPDNDKPGFQAAEDICQELRKIGIQSLKLVDPTLLQKHFPAKWDLADPLPSGLSDQLPQKLLLSSLDKGIDPAQVIHRLSSLYRANDSYVKIRVNEILWRVDARMRPELEQQNGNRFWKVNEAILSETSRILLQQNQTQNQRLTWQTLVYEAAHGKKPTEIELDRMKNIIQKFSGLRAGELSIDRVLTTTCEKNRKEHDMTAKEAQQEAVLVSKFFENQSERIKFIDQCLSKQKDLVKEAGLDVKI